MANKRRSPILSITIVLLVLSIACLCLPFSEIPFNLERIEPAGAATQSSSDSCPSGLVYNKDTQTCEAQPDCISWLADLEELFRYPPKTSEDAPAFDEEILLVTYQVNAGIISNPTFENAPSYLKTYQTDQNNHKAIWQYFTILFPENTRRDLTSFAIMSDGEDNNLAAIERSWDNPDKWMLSVDIMDAADTNELTSTLIHEFGHLLTLNVSQVDPDEEEQSCSTYYAGDGCSLPNAYITAFFNQFWTDIYEEWIEIQTIKEGDEYYNALDDLYWQNRDQFATNYAATSPDEDIAEAWTLFIIAPAPGGDTIVEQKILFFYEYPELIRLREEILSGLCARVP